MTSPLGRPLFVLLSLTFLANCGLSEEDIKRRVAEQEAAEAAQAAKSAGAGVVAAAANAPAEAAIELEEVTVEGMGCKLRIPKGSKTLATGSQLTSYSFPLDQKGLLALGVAVRGYGAADLDKAKADAAPSGGLDKIAEAAALPDGRFEVVLAPRGVTQKVFVYLPERSVQCDGRSKDLATLREICGSLAAI